MGIVTDEVVLRQISNFVSEETNIEDLVIRMKSEIKDTSGLALAAIQIGELLRVVVMKLRNGQPFPNNFLVLVNPVILKSEGIRIFPNESCLSFPGITVRTKRFDKVIIGCSNYKEQLLFDGLESIVIQHDCDHLNGKLFFDSEYKKININRNDPCICGSGKKWKKCCYSK